MTNFKCNTKHFVSQCHFTFGASLQQLFDSNKGSELNIQNL